MRAKETCLGSSGTHLVGSRTPGQTRPTGDASHSCSRFTLPRLMRGHQIIPACCPEYFPINPLSCHCDRLPPLFQTHVSFGELKSYNARPQSKSNHVVHSLGPVYAVLTNEKPRLCRCLCLCLCLKAQSQSPGFNVTHSSLPGASSRPGPPRHGGAGGNQVLTGTALLAQPSGASPWRRQVGQTCHGGYRRRQPTVEAPKYAASSVPHPVRPLPCNDGSAFCQMEAA